MVGSAFGDELTAASDSTILAGDGKDMLYVSGETTGARLSGGADDDTLMVAGTNIGTLNFGGDDGVDKLINTGVIADLTFGGGADGDILQNIGGIIGTLNFGGDDGIDALLLKFSVKLIIAWQMIRRTSRRKSARQ